MENFFKHFTYQKLFVRIEKSENNSLAHVSNDGNYIESFLVLSKTQKDFEEECERYLESDRYKNNLQLMRGY
jgi:hypothetical protein